MQQQPPPPPPREYEEYRLKSTTAANVSHNIMILNSQGSSFADFTPPVRLIRDRKYDSDSDEDDANEDDAAGKVKKPEAGLGRRKRTRILYLEDEDEIALREQESAPWLLEDFDGQHAFTGRLEGGQHGNYVFFVNQGSEFRVLPISRWYRFNPKLSYQTLTLEEAEERIAMAGKMRSGFASTSSQDSTTSAKANEVTGLNPQQQQQSQQKKKKLERLLTVPHHPPAKPKKMMAMMSRRRNDDDEEDREDLDFEDIFDDDDEGFGGEAADDQQQRQEEGPKKSRITSAGKQVKKLIKELDSDNWHAEQEDEEDEEIDPYADDDASSSVIAAEEIGMKPTTSATSSNAAALSNANKVLTPSSQASVPPAAAPIGTSTAKPTTNTNTITETDIIELLSGPAPIKTKDLIGRLKPKLKADPANREVLRELMKRMAVVKASPTGTEDDKFLELKPEYRRV